MKISAAIFFLLFAFPSCAYEVPKDEARIYDLLIMRKMAADGIPAQYATSVETPDPSLPENNPELIKRRFAEEEALRAAAFDQEFGPGSFMNLVDFAFGCDTKKGSSIIDVGGLIEAAYFLRALKDEEQKGLSPDSKEFKKRRKKIMAGMKPYLKKLTPKTGLSPADAQGCLKALGPIADKLLSKRKAAAFARSLKP